MKRIALSIFLLIAVLLNFSGCTTINAEDLMTGIEPSGITGKAADERFINSQMRFSVELFKTLYAQGNEENILISPLSLQLVLAMTANGADGETLAEMEKLLGDDISLMELNEYLFDYNKKLTETEEIKTANSLWIRDDGKRIEPNKEFLQTNADHYGAQVYKALFDSSTVKDINHWANEHTDGRIDKMLEEIPSDAVMYLINALTFDGEWNEKYEKSDITDGVFHSINGDQNVKMMYSSESKYLNDGKATGFIKPYKGGKYSFVAMLPNEGVTVGEYISTLYPETLTKTLRENETGVCVKIPKFKCEYDSRESLNKVLKTMGMKKAFDPFSSDFSRLDEKNRHYISKVAQKTYIRLDENGTKAAALSFVELMNKAVMFEENQVTLDRPFVYMIIDNTTLLPVFMGTLTSIE